MSESQGYKLGMKMGLTNKSALFAKIRREGSKREVELLMGSGPANTAFRRGLKSAAFELSRGKRQSATRQKTTRQRLKTEKRPAAKREDWNQKETTKWFATLGEKIGNFEVWDSWVYAVVDQPVELRASYASGSLEDPGMVWEITQVKGQPAVLVGKDTDSNHEVVERHTGTLAQMKKKLAAISRRKRKNPSMRSYRVSWSMRYLRPIRDNDGEFTVRGTSAEDALSNAHQSLKRMDLEVHGRDFDPLQDTLRASIQNTLDEDWGSLTIVPEKG